MSIIQRPSSETIQYYAMLGIIPYESIPDQRELDVINNLISSVPDKINNKIFGFKRAIEFESSGPAKIFEKVDAPRFLGIDDRGNSQDNLYVNLNVGLLAGEDEYIYRRSTFERIIENWSFLIPRTLSAYGVASSIINLDDAVTLLTWLMSSNFLKLTNDSTSFLKSMINLTSSISIFDGFNESEEYYPSLIWKNITKPSPYSRKSSPYGDQGSYTQGSLQGSYTQDNLYQGLSSSGSQGRTLREDLLEGRERGSLLTPDDVRTEKRVIDNDPTEYVNSDGTPIIKTLRYKQVRTYSVIGAYYLCLCYENFYPSCIPIYQFLALQQPHPLETYIQYLSPDDANLTIEGISSAEKKRMATVSKFLNRQYSSSLEFYRDIPNLFKMFR